MSKRKSNEHAKPSRLVYLQNDNDLVEEEQSVNVHYVPVNHEDEIDPELLVVALEELKEFVDYQNLPIAQFLTTEHLEDFIRQHK